jgi:predicted nucleic acid-binding Zn ribbon protein
MNADLIEVEEGYIFYCNNCNNTFNVVHTFNPVPGLSTYYTCMKCNAVLPVKDLKKRRIINNLLYYLCCCVFIV